MALPLGPLDAGGGPQSNGTGRAAAPLQVAKKKGCKRSKCSKWKGGKCRCGRD